MLSLFEDGVFSRHLDPRAYRSGLTFSVVYALRVTLRQMGPRSRWIFVAPLGSSPGVFAAGTTVRLLKSERNSTEYPNPEKKKSALRRKDVNMPRRARCLGDRALSSIFYTRACPPSRASILR